ncbi:MAG: deoxyribonuclease V [Deltaproteobacteria bacterium]|nr:MAG: deoxyribonuclease V [Deltaproteobacteria bacterium]
MKSYPLSHPWDVTPKEAVEIQKELRELLQLKWDNAPISRAAGIDVSYARGSKEGYAVVVVMGWPNLEEIDIAWTKRDISFPYIPGLLSFREAPLLLHAWEKLNHYPDLIFVDGQGIAHPRSMGLASHLGVLLDIPSIGCAKSPLVGGDPVVGDKRGDHAPLLYQGREIGVALRTRVGVKPLYISPGHRIDLRTSIHWVLRACGSYRLPEPLRQAHIRANRLRSNIYH